MSKISFRYMVPEERETVLPLLFAILHENMSRIMPGDSSYQEDESLWYSWILPALKEQGRKILLIRAGNVLAGYVQYQIRGDTLHVEEIQLKPCYHRTMVFYRTCQYLMENLPEEVQCVESYVNKENINSLSIHNTLGMKRIGENKRGTSWHYRGDLAVMAAHFPRKGAIKG